MSTQQQGITDALATLLATIVGIVTVTTNRPYEEAFGQEHERTYGHRAGPDEPVEIVTINLVARGIPDQSRVPEGLRLDGDYASVGAPRPAYFGAEHGWQNTPILRRADLKVAQTGPCIVEEYDATCVVPPGARAHLDEFGNIVIDIAAPAAANRRDVAATAAG